MYENPKNERMLWNSNDSRMLCKLIDRQKP